MSLLALTNHLKPVELPLHSLYLDPNNPRFVEADWSSVPDDEIDDEEVQDSTRRRLVASFNVEKLRINMEVNGFLPIDRVIVREFAVNKYVVLEGNRRICAAKMISPVGTDGTTTHADVLQSLDMIPVLQYTGGDRNASWIFQGLRHISGVEDWSAFNKAKLLVEQMEEEELSLSEVGKRFGLTSHGAGQWVRGFYAFKRAREESDYISEVDERSYPYFQELFSRSSAAMREWLEWDEPQRTFANKINFNEFVGWLYPRPGEDDETGTTGKGDFEKRRLARRDDIRLLSTLKTEHPEYFQQFRSGSDLEQVYSQALAAKFAKAEREKVNPAEDVFSAILECTKRLENLPLKVIKDPILKERLQSLIVDLEAKISFVKS